MFAISIFLFTVTTAIIGMFFNYCYNKVRDCEKELPKKISYYFGNASRLSSADIIRELRRRLTLKIQNSERNKYTEWLEEYGSCIRDMFIVKMLLVFDIFLIIAFAIYSMIQVL
jgi:hypothetical protein